MAGSPEGSLGRNRLSKNARESENLLSRAPAARSASAVSRCYNADSSNYTFFGAADGVRTRFYAYSEAFQLSDAQQP